jgi:pyruvate dehydrogenase E2 component (dihydrolipoamide acetyltransferase)
MAHVLIMPRQGNTVESCIITNWKVKEGDLVTAESVVCEVETDKASFEVPAGAAGTVLKLLYDSGDDVPVLKPIAVIGAAGENWQVVLGNGELGSDSLLPTPDSPLPVPQSPLPTPHSPLPTPYSPIPIPHSPIQLASFRLKRRLPR